jgi:hypothetical protein
MADTPFVGMRGAADFLSNEEIPNWRAGILRLMPNGTAPLTAITGLMSSEAVDNVTFHWNTKTLPTGRATITGTYRDQALAVAYGTPATYGLTGAKLYVKMAEADTKYFLPGNQVLFRDASDPTVDCNAKVDTVIKNGASSYVAVTLLEDDDNSSLGSIVNADVLYRIGNINVDGGYRPDSLVYLPTSHYNYCQTWRNALDLSRRAMKTRLYTGDAYQEAKRDVLQDHAMDIEKSLIFGIKTKVTGSNGKEETTTDGLIAMIKADASANVSDYSLDTDFSGKKWVEGGQDWLNEMIELMFRDGDVGSRLVFCGSGALLGIQKLVQELGVYSLSYNTTKFGIAVVEWLTPFGTINLKTHPLFSFEETNRYSMLFCVPENMKWRYITDTEFHTDNTFGQGGGTGKDGKEEEWLTDGGLEYHFPSMCGYLNGVGKDSAV